MSKRSYKQMVARQRAKTDRAKAKSLRQSAKDKDGLMWEARRAQEQEVKNRGHS